MKFQTLPNGLDIQGHSVSGLARDQFLKELKESCDSELQYLMKCRDRSISPRRPDYNRLYSDYCKQKYGDRNGVGMFAHLSDVIENYQLENPATSIAFQPYEETIDGNEKIITPFILVMITDLMTRVHEMVRDNVSIQVAKTGVVLWQYEYLFFDELNDL